MWIPYIEDEQITLSLLRSLSCSLALKCYCWRAWSVLGFVEMLWRTSAGQSVWSPHIYRPAAVTVFSFEICPHWNLLAKLNIYFIMQIFTKNSEKHLFYTHTVSLPSCRCPIVYNVIRTYYFLNAPSPLALELFYYGFLISFKPLLKYYKADWWLLNWINFSHEFNNWRPCWEPRYTGFHDRKIGLQKKIVTCRYIYNWYIYIYII